MKIIKFYYELFCQKAINKKKLLEKIMTIKEYTIKSAGRHTNTQHAPTT